MSLTLLAYVIGSSGGKLVGWMASGRFGYFSPSLSLPFCQSHKCMTVAFPGRGGYDSLCLSTHLLGSGCLPSFHRGGDSKSGPGHVPPCIHFPACLLPLLTVPSLLYFTVFCMMGSYLEIISSFYFILWLISATCLIWNSPNKAGHVL